MTEPISTSRNRKLIVALMTVIASSSVLADGFAIHKTITSSLDMGKRAHSAATVDRVMLANDPDEITKVYAKAHGHQTPAVHEFQTRVVCRVEVKGKTATDRLAKVRIRDLSSLKVVDTLYGLIRKHEDEVEIRLDATYALNHLGPGGTTVSYGLEASVNAKQNNGNLYVEPQGSISGPNVLLLHLDGLSIYIAKDAPTSCVPDPTSTFTANQPEAYAKVTLFGTATADDNVTVDFYDATDPDNLVSITPNAATAFTIAMGTSSNRGLIDNTGNTAANGPLYLPSGMASRVIRMVATVKKGTTVVGQSAGTYTILPQ